MHRSNWAKDLTDRLKIFAKEVASILIYSGFLAVWVIVQWALNEHVVKRLKLSAIDNLALLCFQFIFAASTLVVIVTYIYTEVIVIILRARRRIRREAELNRGSDSKNE